MPRVINKRRDENLRDRSCNVWFCLIILEFEFSSNQLGKAFLIIATWLVERFISNDETNDMFC